MNTATLVIEKSIPIPPRWPEKPEGSCGLCRRKARPGLKTCDYHLAKVRKSYVARRAKGLCGYGACPKKARTGHSMCPEHNRYSDQRIRELLDGRIAQGICRRCGERPIIGTKTFCLICYAKCGGINSGAPKHPLPGSIRKIIHKFWRLDRIDKRRATAEQAIENLRDDRMQRVLSLRHGLIDGIDHTLEDVGQELGVTRERVRQIENKAYDILKALGVDVSFRQFKDIQRPIVASEPSRRAPSKYQRRKANAHRLVKEALESGRVTRKACEREGCDYKGKIIAHHEDYDKPLDVIWLCPSHHSEAHGRNRRENPPIRPRYTFPAWLERARADVTSEHYDAPQILETLKKRQVPQREVVKATGVPGIRLAKIVRGQAVKDADLLAVLRYVDSLNNGG